MAMLNSMWNLSFPIRDRTCAPCVGCELEVQSLDCQGHPNLGTFLSQFSPLEKTQFHVRHL